MGARKALFGVLAILTMCLVTTVLSYAAPDADPTNLQGQALDSGTIRWTWNDNSSDEDGFEVRDTSNNPIGSVGTDVSLYDESGLSENTQYTRRVIGYTEVNGSDTDALSYPASFSSGSSWYTMGFQFTLNSDITVTQVKVYAGSNKATIWTDGGTVLSTIEPATSASEWTTWDLPAPLDLSNGQTYRIAVYTYPYRSTSMLNVSPTSDITIDSSRYSSGDNFPTIENISTMYGVVNFVYHTTVKDPSAPTSDVATYTAVHDPTASDFSLSDIGSSQVQIDVTPPPNQAAGDTGVFVQRILEGEDWGTDAVDVTTVYTSTYTVTDTVPANGNYLYRIRFRNGDQVETAWSTDKFILMKSYPPAAPTGFSGTLMSPTSIQWSWTDNSSDETGFIIEDTSDNPFVYSGKNTATALETGLSENTEYTRQCRAYIWPHNPEIEACAYDGTYSSASSGTYYHRGFIFIPKANIEITRVSRYAGSEIRVHDYSGTLLNTHTFSATPDATWVEEDLSAPWTLSGGIPYRISVYQGSSYTYYYDPIASVTETADIDITSGCYGTTYPNYTSTSIYGLVNFKYRVLFNAAAGYDGVYYNNSTTTYPQGFRFTTSQDIWVTALSRMRGTKVTIHDDATEAVLVEHTFSSAPNGDWTEEALALPLKLDTGKTYRISTWNDGTSYTYTYEYLSNVRAGSTLTINNGCYGNSTSGQWPISISTSYIYGLVNLKYTAQPNCSDPSNTDTLYTPIHDPGDADLLLEDLGSAQVRITVTKPLNDNVGSTGVYIERSDDPGFTTPFEVPNGWTDGADGDGNPYTRTDTVPSNGTWYYRIKFRNQVSVETNWYSESIDIISYPPADPSGFMADSGSISTTSITWQWTDNSNDEVGFELQDGGGGWIADAGSDATSYTESGLSENTQYTRDVVAYNLVAGTEAMDQNQTFTTSGSNYTYSYGTRRYGQTFTPAINGILTKIDFYGRKYAAGSLDPTVFVYPTSGGLPDTSGGPLAQETITGMTTTTQWYTVTFSSPPTLQAGTLYAIAFGAPSAVTYNHYIYYGSGYASGQRVYTTSTIWTPNTTYDLAFRTYMIPYTRNYSSTTTSVSAYTLVHDPVDADLQLTDLYSGGQVEITVTPPPNPTADSTGVYIERDTDGDWAGGDYVVITGDWTQTYTQIDTVPANGLYYYRITFRNGDGTPTASYIESIDVIGYPPNAPDSFFGDNITTDSVTWNWNDNSSDEHGFEVQDNNDNHVVDAAADATSAVESGLTENTIYDRHCHSYTEAGAGALWSDINPSTATTGSSPSVAFNGNPEPLSNMQTEDSSTYWSCDYQNFAGSDPQSIWAAFDFDISSTGLSGSDIESMSFTSKVYFTGSTSTVPINDSMEFDYIDMARIQIYNFTSTSWESLGSDFFNATGRSATWRDGAEAIIWDYTTDTNPNNPIIRSKDSGWSDDYISAGAIKVRVFIEGYLAAGGSWDAMWVFDHVKVDIQERQVRIISTETNNATACTLIHEPVDADITVTDLYSGGQVDVVITPPVNPASGLTGVYIERDLEGDWTGADYAVVGGDWTQTYTHTDTLPANGTWYYRIKFRNQVGVETGEYIEAFNMGSFPPDAPDGFQADSGSISSTSITWQWNDNSTNEEGFELQDDTDTWIADASAEATSYTESGLTENTQYTRHVRAYSLIPGSEQDALTYTDTPNSTTSTYNMGFRFQANADLTITKVKTYVNGQKVTIWADDGTLLKTIDPTLGDNSWPSFDVTPPLTLTSGQYYRIAVWVTGYHSISMSYVTWTSDLLDVVSYYSTSDTFPNSILSGTMYGVVNFVYRKDTRVYSGISEEISIYTAVHNPVDADFTVTAGAFGEADIVVTPPNNQDVGQTGVRISRSPNSDMSGAVIIKDYDVPGYTYTDTVPSGGTWYYAITFRNADGLETTESPPKSVVVSGPIGVPGNFTGEGTATDTITWTWEEVASVDGYLLQDETGSTVALIDAPASSHQETVSGENEPSTKQLRSCITAATQLAVLPPLPVTGCTIPWYIDGSRVQQLYTSAELSGVEGFIRSIHWQRLNQGAAASYSNVTVRLGHTSMSELTASFAGNFTEGDDKIVWFASTYAVEATTIDYAWYELTLTDEFYYNGTDNLIVDINVESGDSTIGWSRGAGVNSMLYGYPGGTVGTLQPRKLYIWLDVDEVTNKSTPAGPVTAYSMIHDAVTGDMMLSDTGSLGVDIMIQQPPYATAGLTGVKVERADDELFTSGVTEVQAFAPIYSLTDTVSAPGQYWYRITYRNGNGKESGTSQAKDVVVTGAAVAPFADFTATPTSGFTPLTVSFTDLSTGTITTWSWDFGDGVGTSTEKNPVYEYTSAGLFTVSLTVTGPAGSDFETKVDYITVTDAPAITADFYAVPTAGTVSLLVQFYDSSTGTVNTWEWDFDNDAVIDSTAQNPTWLYNTAGTYTVSLKVTGPAGEHTETKIDYIEVVPPGAPIADFSATPTSGTVALLVNFSDESVGTINTWSWDFGDGVGTSTDQNPTYTYNIAGTYTVTLTVSGPGGSDDEIKVDYITVNPPAAPVADFSATPTSGLVPLLVTFADESTGTITSWAWDFDNDTVIDSTAQNPTHTYNTAGTYTVSLTVTGPGGSDTETKTDYIQVNSPVAPTAEFSGSPTSGSATLTVNFTDESTGDITSWAWDFGDGDGTSTEQHPSYDYTLPGTYTVSLTVTGPAGSDTETKVDYIVVFDPSTLNADFTASPLNGPAALTVNFTDTSIGNFDTWSWNFGDGTTSTEQNPTHTYNIVGSYTVTLSIDGPDGNDSEEKTDYITVIDPGTMTADFTASPTSGVAPLDVQFTDLSVGAIDSWSWDFGDGGTSTQRNPTYQYTDPGLYTVTLSVSGPTFSDSETKTNYINVTETPPPPDSDSGKGGCSCSVDAGPTPFNHLLGYFIPVMLLACAYLALRRKNL